MRLIFEAPDEGTELVRTVSGSSVPSTVEVRFEPLDSSDTLSGKPTAWCNSPNTGKPLIFDIPTPSSASAPDTTGTLVVTRQNSGTSVELPIRIKRT